MAGDKGGSDAFRLPSSVTPTHYAVTIKTHLDSLTFEGHALIDVTFNEPTADIILHAHAPLVVKRAALLSSALKTSTRQEAASIDVDEKLERVTVHFDEAAHAKKGAKAKLALAFTGQLESSMMGYYKSAFEVDGQTSHYALTQFEPTAARRAFPCWDEPAIKATFQLTLVAKKGSTALANMPAEDSFDFDGDLVFPLSDDAASTASEKGPKGPKGQGEWTATRYETTPKMSTYLVAWANGPFESLESSYTSPLTGNKVPLKIYATKDHIHQAQLALDVKAKVLPIYERIFDVAYPLPKLDTLVASDFDAGAMENWGLITGRTSVYLYDEKKSGIAAKKRTAGVQSHEVSHQWFGNIVTMEWWDNLWLNEAFATLMGEIIVINEIYPEWRVHSSFINEHLKCSTGYQPLSTPYQAIGADSALINQIFDAISYSKGASVLKMLSNMMGEKTFLKGVSLYLKGHLYGNSRTKDLWAGISEASGLDVAKIMANWTLKVGFPVVTVEETSDGLKVKQNRFLSTGDPTPEEDETLWYIPLEIKTVGNDGNAVVDHKAVLDGRETTIKLDGAKERVYKLNAETAGVYRVRYSPERLAKLGEEAARKDSVFTINDRMGLVQDAYLLAKAGYGQSSGSLNLLSKLSGEEENLVWTEIDGAVGDMVSTWWEQPEEVRNGLKAFRANLFRPILKKLGFEPVENESSDVSELRRTAVSSLAGSDDAEVVGEIKRRFALLVDQDDDSAIPGDLRQIIFTTAVRTGGEREYEKVLSIFRKPATPQAKTSAMLALCYGSTPELRKRTETLLLKEVKEQDMMYFFAGFAANRNSRQAIWQFLQDNFAEMSKRFTGNFSFSRLVQYSFDSLSSYKDADAVEAFFKDKDTSSFNQALQQGLDSVRSKAGWLRRDTGDVEQWLSKNGYLASGKAKA